MCHAEYIFQISPLDTSALLPQVSQALEKRTELISRKQFPNLWKHTDQLNAIEREPSSVSKRRRLRTKVWSLVCLALGIFLFLPGLMTPQELLAPLLMGAVAIGAGISGLWISRQNKKNPFDKSAKLLLAGRDSFPANQTKVLFSSDGMFVAETNSADDDRKTANQEVVAYKNFEYIIETDDLFILTYNNSITILQKQDLITGSIDDFLDFMSSKAVIVR